MAGDRIATNSKRATELAALDETTMKANPLEQASSLPSRDSIAAYGRFFSFGKSPAIFQFQEKQVPPRLQDL